MKNKKILAILAMTVTLSMAMSACSFGGEKPDEVVEVTPTPEPTKAPDPTPTVAPDVQDSTYTSADKSVSIKLPNATWANKTDDAKMLSFESPDEGKILILYGSGEEDMGAAIIPSTQDMAVRLQQADDMVEGTDFEIQNFTANEVSGVNVYSYVVKMLNKEKSGGYAYVVNKVFSNDNEYYNLSGSVKQDSAEALSAMQTAINSFQIKGDSTLKPAAAGGNGGGDGNAAAGQNGGNGDGTGTDGGQTSDGGSGSGGNISDAALSDTNQTRTIYRNSDGQPLVITNDGSGNWVDENGNSYDFATDEDVYDQDGTDYYYHGEAADVYYMPVDGGYDDYDDYDDSGDYE